MELTRQQDKLLQFVKECHSGQVRKYCGEEYWNHPYRVAELVDRVVDYGIEIALCHDLLEDTECTYKTLFSLLESIGYSYRECNEITSGVNQLTDVYTTEDYPKMNRSKRKELEQVRLSEIDKCIQTIKYADFIDNTRSIVEGDRGFAKVYLREKKTILNTMRGGNIDLFVSACYELKKGELELLTK
jgi:(p)ppGpp synthase/HD superfamily hydrolase